METRAARPTLPIDPAKKRRFERIRAALGVTFSQRIRKFIRETIEAHGGPAGPAARARSAGGKAQSRASA